MKEFIRRCGKWLNKRVLTAAGLCLLLAAAVATNILVNRSRDDAKESSSGLFARLCLKDKGNKH